MSEPLNVFEQVFHDIVLEQTGVNMCPGDTKCEARKLMAKARELFASEIYEQYYATITPDSVQSVQSPIGIDTEKIEAL